VLLGLHQAEFLPNEVPDVLEPDEIRAKMAGTNGEESTACGLEIAREISRAALERYRSVDLNIPFLRYSVTVELASFARTL
jgi:hypothetical protein